MRLTLNLKVLGEFCYAQIVVVWDLRKHAYEHVHLVFLGEVRDIEAIDGLAQILDVMQDWQDFNFES